MASPSDALVSVYVWPWYTARPLLWSPHRRTLLRFQLLPEFVPSSPRIRTDVLYSGRDLLTINRFDALFKRCCRSDRTSGSSTHFTRHGSDCEAVPSKRYFDTNYGQRRIPLYRSSNSDAHCIGRNPHPFSNRFDVYRQ